ncbi:MAG TPA: transcriptional regulator [Firmicutes bacterium]|jgi:CRP-like cAMP-binding protein|nr:transcriptional regulator [Bacillota bacterium]HAW71872.1 transcriptional regulator [Bacillota bacterium]HAZ22419.1 transcriptional regulator [Bacillota bacterium]HBG45339.1 transcriptional regulator [Bacillota bacterium]HBL50289.1 transcriptional regulator [Bacillota bacterium]
MEHLAEKVDQCSLFRDISRAELAAMLHCLQPVVRKYHKDELLTVEGEPLSALGIVVAGNAAVTKESVAGSRLIMTLLERPMMFGEMAAFSDTPIWPATVVAQSDCEVLFIQAQSIVGQCQKHCAYHQQLIYNMLSIVTNRALVLNRKVEFLLLKSVREKVVVYLLEQYRQTGKEMFVLPLDRNEMADFLNVTRPALSREMGRMRDEGLIDYHRASIKILDVEGMRRALEGE